MSKAVVQKSVLPKKNFANATQMNTVTPVDKKKGRFGTFMGSIGQARPSLSPPRSVRKHEDKNQMIRQLRFVMDDWERNKR